MRLDLGPVCLRFNFSVDNKSSLNLGFGNHMCRRRLGLNMWPVKSMVKMLGQYL